eukprot:TRINITY_DN574_c0_g1_i1.p1 TRINITY_DN574_c0_g1~~TRINITY_DN574_c0_g1_i1.p1  ORF type:complete len:159 (-),score=42.04 TRINITY_DN574_c0_g1_i1:206-682(-)
MELDPPAPSASPSPPSPAAAPSPSHPPSPSPAAPSPSPFYGLTPLEPHPPVVTARTDLVDENHLLDALPQSSSQGPNVDETFLPLLEGRVDIKRKHIQGKDGTVRSTGLKALALQAPPPQDLAELTSVQPFSPGAIQRAFTLDAGPPPKKNPIKLSKR